MLQWLTVICIVQNPRIATYAYKFASDWHRATASARPAYLVKACHNLQTNNPHGNKDYVKRNFPYSVPVLQMEQGSTSHDGSIRNTAGIADVESISGKVKNTFSNFTDLDIIEFEGVLNFRSALPGTGLPIYRCAALDNVTSSDAVRLLTPGIINSSSSSDNKWYN